MAKIDPAIVVARKPRGRPSTPTDAALEESYNNGWEAGKAAGFHTAYAQGHAEALDEVKPQLLPEDQNLLLQAILDGMGDLPGVFERMESYLIGRGYDEARSDILRLRGWAYGTKDHPEADRPCCVSGGMSGGPNLDPNPQASRLKMRG